MRKKKREKILFSYFHSKHFHRIKLNEVKQVKKLKRRLIILLITAFLLTMLFFWCVIKLLPLVRVQAEASVRNLAYSVISEVTLEVMSKEGTSYADLVEILKDAEGNITALSTKSENVNILKSHIVSGVVKQLNESKKKDISIPLGNLTKSLWLTGRGAKIKVRVLESSSIKAEMNSSFSSVGINQTRHTVFLEVSLKMQISVLTRTFELDVLDSIVLADTVIVGKVPDGYTSINKASDDLIGDIVDFKAE